jgi:hypothetical protein
MMKLIEAWELFKKHNINTCGTHKLLVRLKRPLPNGIREGYICEEPYDCDNELYLDDILEIEDYDPFEEEVESVYCPYCCEIIYSEE